MSRPALALIALSFALPACGVRDYRPSRDADFEMDRDVEIDDEDIRKAFAARPQLPTTAFHVAYYTFDPEIVKDLDATLAAVPGVASVYRIPPLLVTGLRRVDEVAPREVSVKKLRLLAARAHADVLVIADHGYRTGGTNGLAAFNALLVPALFLPFLDNTVDGYAEAFVLDVRNGYLYGHINEEDRRGDPYATIYDKSAVTIAEEQWTTLRDALRKDLTRLIESERARGAQTPALDRP
jgi:hypothetical protein